MALDQITSLGPFFAVDTHAAGSRIEPPWHPMSVLTADPDLLAAHVEGVRRQLSASGGPPVDTRTAASVAQLGLAARVISPALAIAVLCGDWPRLSLAELRWQRVPGGTFPLSVSDTALAAGTPADLLGGLLSDLVDCALPLSVSRKVLWGNIASAVNGAAMVLAGTRPDAARRTWDLAGELLGQPALRETWDTDSGRRFRRLSCCLIYRASRTAAVCGDCVLRRL